MWCKEIYDEVLALASMGVEKSQELLGAGWRPGEPGADLKAWEPGS